MPEVVKAYKKDQVELLVRYMLQLTADEQRRLSGMLPAAARSNTSGTDLTTRTAIARR